MLDVKAATQAKDPAKSRLVVLIELVRRYVCVTGAPDSYAYLLNCVIFTALGFGYFSSVFIYSPTTFKYGPITHALL
jgi:hypothetical protein